MLPTLIPFCLDVTSMAFLAAPYRSVMIGCVRLVAAAGMLALSCIMLCSSFWSLARPKLLAVVL